MFDVAFLFYAINKKMTKLLVTAAESSLGSALVFLVLVLGYKVYRMKTSSDCGTKDSCCRFHAENPGGTAEDLP